MTKTSTATATIANYIERRNIEKAAARRQVLASLRTYRSATLGVVTIPDND